MSHVIRRFEPTDRERMARFAAALPEHDLLFLGRDLRHPRVVEAWLQAIAEGWIDSLVAEDGGELVGSAALVRDPLGWSPHVGEVRLLVSAERRGHGLGRDLLEAVFAIAAERGLAKLTAQMTPDQTGAVQLFESLGFRGGSAAARSCAGPRGKSARPRRPLLRRCAGCRSAPCIRSQMNHIAVRGFETAYRRRSSWHPPFLREAPRGRLPHYLL